MTDDHSRAGHRADEPVVLSTEEARAGASAHTTRYALGWGLVLVIFAFVALLAFYMLRT